MATTMKKTPVKKTVKGVGSAKVTKFQKLKKANKRHCDTGSDSTKKSLEKAISDYRNDAMKKGKSAGDIQKIIRENTGCKR